MFLVDLGSCIFGNFSCNVEFRRKRDISMFGTKKKGLRFLHTEMVEIRQL